MSKRTPKQQAALKQCLGDGPIRRGRFKEALIAAMNRRKRVCIQCLVEEVARDLGEQYGIWAEEILRVAAEASRIEVNCLKGIH
jgi:hypothetical protein